MEQVTVVLPPGLRRTEDLDNLKLLLSSLTKADTVAETL